MKIKRKPVMAARGYNDDTVYVIFRKIRVEGQWIPCAFWYSSGQTVNYGRLYVIEPEFGGYICEEADMSYYNASKKLTPADPEYDDLKAYTYDWLSDHGDGQGGFKNIVERQRVDYNALRNSWYRDTIPDDDSVEYSVHSSTGVKKRPVTASVKYNVIEDDSLDIVDVFDNLEDAIAKAKEHSSKYGVDVIVEREYTEGEGDRSVAYRNGYSDADDTTVVWTSDGAAEQERYNASSSTRSSKRSVTAAADGHNPYEQIELSRPDIIARWQSEYEGEPSTSWENIFENALEDFKLYAGDEASGNILNEFIDGDFDEIDMYNEFEQFVMWKDLADYDY